MCFNYKVATMWGLRRGIFIVFGLHWLAGCAGLTASISSRNAPGGNIDRNASFHFLVPEGASVEERKVFQALIGEFRVQGFKVASEPSKTGAEYAVAVAFAETSSATTSSMPMTLTQFETIRDVRGLPVGAVQSESTADVPYSTDYRVRTVFVSLFTVDGMGAPDRGHPVWHGTITAGAKALSSHSRCIVRELVRRLGTEYDARTRIDIACRSR